MFIKLNFTSKYIRVKILKLSQGSHRALVSMGAMPPSWWWWGGGVPSTSKYPGTCPIGKVSESQRKEQEKRENHLPNKLYSLVSRMEKEERKFFREVEKEKNGRKVWKVRKQRKKTMWRNISRYVVARLVEHWNLYHTLQMSPPLETGEWRKCQPVPLETILQLNLILIMSKTFLLSTRARLRTI